MWRRLWPTLVHLPRNCGIDAPGSLHHPLFKVNSNLLPIVGCRPKSASKKVDLTYLIPEKDLEENFILGSGPGGQAVATTKNCCFLKHVPTGVFVKCHKTRSLEVNREVARKLLAEKVDLHLHGEDSQLRIREREKSEEKQKKKLESKRLLEMRKAFNEQVAAAEAKENKDS